MSAKKERENLRCPFYRPPLEEFIDYKIFLDIGFDEMLRRAEARDAPRFGAEILAKYREKYIPVQKKYLEMYKPREKAIWLLIIRIRFFQK